MRKLFVMLLALVVFSGLVSAETEPPSSEDLDIAAAVHGLCLSIKAGVPIIAFVMLLIAGLIYAAGQIMGAETRARANVWATALLTGGIIGLLIAASAKYVLRMFVSFFTTDVAVFDDLDFCEEGSLFTPHPIT